MKKFNNDERERSLCWFLLFYPHSSVSWNGLVRAEIFMPGRVEQEREWEWAKLVGAWIIYELHYSLRLWGAALKSELSKNFNNSRTLRLDVL